MNTILQLFDRLTEKIPPEVIKKIRIILLSLWFVVAIVIAVYSWKMGTSNAPQKGQDLYLSEIKEKAEIEKNLEKAPDVTVPDVHDLIPGDDSIRGPTVRSPYRRGLDEESGSESRTGEKLPPFLGEKTEPVFPSRTGVSEGEMENRLEPGTRSDENEMPLLPPGESGPSGRRDSSQDSAAGSGGSGASRGTGNTERNPRPPEGQTQGKTQPSGQPGSRLFQDRWKRAEPLMEQ